MQVSLTMFTEPVKCPPSWPKQGNSCFQMIEEKLSWFDAEIRCIKEGGHLASVHSKEEMDVLQELASKHKNLNVNYFWIGANDLMKEGQFDWSDGLNISFSNWRPRHPTENTKKNCVSFWRYDGNKWDGLWFDNSCVQKYISFCKISEEASKPEQIQEPEQGMAGAITAFGKSGSN